jgi:hypothetical protein
MQTNKETRTDNLVPYILRRKLVLRIRDVSRVQDLNFFPSSQISDPGLKRSGSRIKIRIKDFSKSIFNPKIWKYEPPNHGNDFYSARIPDTGVNKAPDHGSATLKETNQKFS